MSDSGTQSRPRGTNALSLERRADGVAVLRVDVPGRRLNLLRAGLVDELDRMLDTIEHASDLRAVVLASGKPDHFIGGVDLRVLQAVRFASEGAELAYSGQRVFGRLADCHIPMVAALHGLCVGGGLELALACHGRVASSDEATRLGLPEVELGLLPALGGTQRLPGLVGLRHALELLLSGTLIDAPQAARIGLVDEVVARSILLQVAIQRALALAHRPRPRSKLRGALRAVLGTRDAEQLRVTDNLVARRFMLARARRRVLASTRGNYPAPQRILEAVKTGLEHGMHRGLDAEAQAFGQLVTSPQAAQLINLFFQQRALKKDLGVDHFAALPHPLGPVEVVGSSPVAAGIALLTAARARLPVRLRDADHASVAQALRSIHAILDRRVARLRLTVAERERILARIAPVTDQAGSSDATVVIDAVAEDLRLKRQVLREVQARGRSDVVYASHASVLPVGSVAEASQSPERVIGMHYFDPVHRMPLLEVVATPRTHPSVVASCVELGKRQGKTVIVVRDGVGFYTSRILHPYLTEAAYLLAQGVAVPRIDAALVDWGFSVGPFALLDEMGLDVHHGVARALREAFGERMAPPQSCERVTGSGRLGRRSGRGYYLYRRGKRTRPDPGVYTLLQVRPTCSLPAGEIVQRCVLRMVNEAVLCLSSGILRNARDGDVGAVFGLGFPAFRGGPFRYVDEVGAEEIVRRLRGFEKELGMRFTPAPRLLEMAGEGRAFYAAQPVRPRDG